MACPVLLLRRAPPQRDRRPRRPQRHRLPRGLRPRPGARARRAAALLFVALRQRPDRPGHRTRQRPGRRRRAGQEPARHRRRRDRRPAHRRRRPGAGGRGRPAGRLLDLHPALVADRDSPDAAGGHRPGARRGRLLLQGQLPDRLRLPARSATARPSAAPSPPSTTSPATTPASGSSCSTGCAVLVPGWTRAQPGRPRHRAGRAARLRRRPAQLPPGRGRHRGLPGHRPPRRLGPPPRPAGRLPDARRLQRARLAALHRRPAGRPRPRHRGADPHPEPAGARRPGAAGRAVLARACGRARRRRAGVPDHAAGRAGSRAQPDPLPHLGGEGVLPAARRHRGQRSAATSRACGPATSWSWPRRPAR